MLCWEKIPASLGKISAFGGNIRLWEKNPRPFRGKYPPLGKNPAPLGENIRLWGKYPPLGDFI
jgi:hypothetical protein